MTKNQLIDQVERFYGDTSRSREDTREDLKEVADRIQELIESLEE